MIVVLDASAAVEIALEKTSAEIFRKELFDASLVLAPDTYTSEITNVFWKYHIHAAFPEKACLEGIDFCIGMVETYVPSLGLWREAFFEASKEKHPVYDMLYLVAARRHHAHLLTKDKKLGEIASRKGIYVIS
jgi:predicted nucleic acid-binding protein